MGTLVMLVCRFVLGFNNVGGDYQTIALTASLDTIALLLLLWLKRQRSAA